MNLTQNEVIMNLLIIIVKKDAKYNTVWMFLFRTLPYTKMVINQLSADTLSNFQTHRLKDIDGVPTAKSCLLFMAVYGFSMSATEIILKSCIGLFTATSLQLYEWSSSSKNVE